jgi:hypothetical protein
MKVLKCQLEDLPDHIAAIQTYTHFFNIDMVSTGIRNGMIWLTTQAYHSTDGSIMPTKLVDDTGQVVLYLMFCYGKTMPVSYSKGLVMTEYGKQHYKLESFYSAEVIREYLEFAFKEDTKRFLLYQRKARSRITNKILKSLTGPGLPLEGWKISVIADIPPNTKAEDELMGKWVIGRLDGIVPQRMTVTQLTKIA